MKLSHNHPKQTFVPSIKNFSCVATTQQKKQRTTSIFLLIFLLSISALTTLVSCATSEGTAERDPESQVPGLFAIDITSDALAPNSRDANGLPGYVSHRFFTDPRINFLNGLPKNTYRLHVHPQDGTQVVVYPVRLIIDDTDKVLGRVPKPDDRYLAEYSLSPIPEPSPGEVILATLDTTTTNAVFTNTDSTVMTTNTEVATINFHRRVTSSPASIELRVKLTPNTAAGQDVAEVQPVTLTLRLNLYKSDNDARLQQAQSATAATDYIDISTYSRNGTKTPDLREAYRALRGILTNYQRDSADPATNYSDKVIGFTNFVPYARDYGIVIGSAYTGVIGRSTPAQQGEFVFLKDLFNDNTGEDLLVPVSTSDYSLSYKLFLDTNLTTAQRQIGIYVPLSDEVHNNPTNDDVIFRRGNDYAAYIGLNNKDKKLITRYVMALSVAANPVTHTIEILKADGSLECSVSLANKLFPNNNTCRIENKYNINFPARPLELNAGEEYTFVLHALATNSLPKNYVDSGVDAGFALIDTNDQVIPLADHGARVLSKQFSFTLAAGETREYKIMNIIGSSLMAQDVVCQERRKAYFAFTVDSLKSLEICRFYQYKHNPLWIRIKAKAQ